jgi:hypothetical protein
MKRMATLISVVTVSMVSSALAISAAEQYPVSFEEYGKLLQSNIKDQCLVVAKNCAAETDTVQQRVNDLRREIAKGLYVYTPDELRTLKDQLRWIESESGNQFI